MSATNALGPLVSGRHAFDTRISKRYRLNDTSTLDTHAAHTAAINFARTVRTGAHCCRFGVIGREPTTLEHACTVVVLHRSTRRLRVADAGGHEVAVTRNNGLQLAHASAGSTVACDHPAIVMLVDDNVSVDGEHDIRERVPYVGAFCALTDVERRIARKFPPHRVQITRAPVRIAPRAPDARQAAHPPTVARDPAPASTDARTLAHPPTVVRTPAPPAPVVREQTPNIASTPIVDTPTSDSLWSAPIVDDGMSVGDIARAAFAFAVSYWAASTIQPFVVAMLM
jgi:hypothetical protein